MRQAFLLLFLGLLCCTIAAGRHISLTVEHSLDGRHFTKAGQIDGDLNLGAGKYGKTLVFQRDLLTSGGRDKLAQLVKANGLYKVRVAASTAGAVALTSIPAQCLVSANCTERLHLHLTSRGEVTALNFALLQCPCHAGLVRADSLPGSWSFEEESPVPVWLPEIAPALHLAPKPPQDKDKTPMQQAKGRSSAEDLAGARTNLKEGEEEPEPPKDERTWLQKNWLILLPLGFVLVNVLGQMDPNAGGGAGRGAAGRGGAAAPARRR